MSVVWWPGAQAFACGAEKWLPERSARGGDARKILPDIWHIYIYMIIYDMNPKLEIFWYSYLLWVPCQLCEAQLALMEQNFQLHAQLRKDQGLQLSPPSPTGAVKGAITRMWMRYKRKYNSCEANWGKLPLKILRTARRIVAGNWQRKIDSLCNTWVTWNDRLKSNFGTFMNFHEVFWQNKINQSQWHALGVCLRQCTRQDSTTRQATSCFDMSRRWGV